MERRKNVETIPVWVRTNSKQEILFEGSYEDALKFGEGNFMSKNFYNQYKSEMVFLYNNLCDK